MREIKFRFFSPYGDGMRYEHDGWAEGIGINEAIKSSIDDYNWKIMQFTGLLDKEGKEIYEGDIVEYISIYHNKFVGEVSWNPFNSMAGFQTTNPHINIFKQDQIKVIGNIYENPELLK